jgi:hypothetical protein
LFRFLGLEYELELTEDESVQNEDSNSHVSAKDEK